MSLSQYGTPKQTKLSSDRWQFGFQEAELSSSGLLPNLTPDDEHLLSLQRKKSIVSQQDFKTVAFFSFYPNKNSQNFTLMCKSKNNVDGARLRTCGQRMTQTTWGVAVQAQWGHRGVGVIRHINLHWWSGSWVSKPCEEAVSSMVIT